MSEIEIKEESAIKEEGIKESDEVKEEENPQATTKEECITKHNSSEALTKEIKEEEVIKDEITNKEESKLEGIALNPVEDSKLHEHEVINQKIEVKEDEAPRRSARGNTSKPKASKEDTKKSITKLPSSTPSIIDIHKLNKKVCLAHSDCLFVIFEITMNPKKYGLDTSSKSRGFWDKLNELHVFTKILEVYKSETLRKYWRNLADVENPTKILDIIKQHKEAIDETNLKLLTIINLIAGYADGSIIDLEECLRFDNLTKISSTNIKKEEKEEKEDESVKLTNHKRKKENIDAMLMLSKEEIAELDLTTEKMVRSTRTKTPNQLFTSLDKSNFEQIEDIISTLSKHLPECSIKRIIEALKMNSFNVINAYLYLKDPDKYESKLIL